MNINEAVSSLVDEILVNDPIDWGYLQVDEDVAKNLIVSSTCKYWQELLKENNSQNDINIAMLTIACKLSLENFCLHLQLRQKDKNAY